VFEWIIGLILKRSGILVDGQKRTKWRPRPDLLEVSGKCDFIAGGKPDFAKAMKEMEELDMPHVFVKATEKIKEFFDREYPEGLGEKPLEIKSVSSFMYESIDRLKKGSRIHRLQCFHYVKSLGYTEGSLIYICRDDMRMLEIPIYNNKEMNDEYEAFIEEVTLAYKAGTPPPLEKPIIFDEDFCKFSANFNVGYSGYLTLLYGLKNQGEFDDMYRPKVAKWNRVLGRLKRGDTITKKNLEVIIEIEESGFNVAEISKKFSSIPDPEEEDVTS